MFKRISIVAAMLVFSAACIVMLPLTRQAAAQSAGMFIDAVDLDIVPAERDNFLAAIYDNEAAYKAHRETEHFKKYAATTNKKVARRDARQMSVVASNAK